MKKSLHGKKIPIKPVSIDPKSILSTSKHFTLISALRQDIESSHKLLTQPENQASIHHADCLNQIGSILNHLIPVLDTVSVEDCIRHLPNIPTWIQLVVRKVPRLLVSEASCELIIRCLLFYVSKDDKTKAKLEPKEDDLSVALPQKRKLSSVDKDRALSKASEWALRMIKQVCSIHDHPSASASFVSSKFANPVAGDQNDQQKDQDHNPNHHPHVMADILTTLAPYSGDKVDSTINDILCEQIMKMLDYHCVPAAMSQTNTPDTSNIIMTPMHVIMVVSSAVVPLLGTIRGHQIVEKLIDAVLGLDHECSCQDRHSANPKHGLACCRTQWLSLVFLDIIPTSWDPFTPARKRLLMNAYPSIFNHVLVSLTCDYDNGNIDVLAIMQSERAKLCLDVARTNSFRQLGLIQHYISSASALFFREPHLNASIRTSASTVIGSCTCNTSTAIADPNVTTNANCSELCRMFVFRSLVHHLFQDKPENENRKMWPPCFLPCVHDLMRTIDIIRKTGIMRGEDHDRDVWHHLRMDLMRVQRVASTISALDVEDEEQEEDYGVGDCDAFLASEPLSTSHGLVLTAHTQLVAVLMLSLDVLYTCFRDWVHMNMRKNPRGKDAPDGDTGTSNIKCDLVRTRLELMLDVYEVVWSMMKSHHGCRSSSSIGVSVSMKKAFLEIPKGVATENLNPNLNLNENENQGGKRGHEWMDAVCSALHHIPCVQCQMFWLFVGSGWIVAYMEVCESEVGKIVATMYVDVVSGSPKDRGGSGGSGGSGVGVCMVQRILLHAIDCMLEVPICRGRGGDDGDDNKNKDDAEFARSKLDQLRQTITQAGHARI